MLQGMGYETGVDLAKLVTAGALAQELVGRTLPGKTLQAELATRARTASRRRRRGHERPGVERRAAGRRRALDHRRRGAPQRALPAP